MTEEEIEVQAEEYAKVKDWGFYVARDSFNDVNNLVVKSFQDGAKWGMEHAIEWHDLRKNPEDLPKAKERRMYRVIYSNPAINEPCLWYLPNLKSWSHSLSVIAWCELPKFKDKE